MKKKRLRVYYAHCIALYDTPQEERDVATLEALGFVVVNPNESSIEATVQAAKHRGTDYMRIFRDIIADCDWLAFRATPDGAITSGVFAELGYAAEFGLPVIELPSGIQRRGLTKEQTREYIREVGKR